MKPSFFKQKLIDDEKKYNEKTAKKNADMMNGSHVSTENDNDPVVRTRDDNERKSFAHPWFNGITIGEIDRLRLEKLMFVLAYDDVTNQSIDMEMQRLLLEQRLKEEENVKQEALKSLGFDEIDESLLVESSDEDDDGEHNDDDDGHQNPFADDDFYSDSSSSEDDDDDDDEGEEKDGNIDEFGNIIEKKKKDSLEASSEIDRDSLVIIPTIEVSFEVVLWIVYILINKVQYSTLESINRTMFCDLTGGSEGQLAMAVSLLMQFEQTMSFEDSIEEHELACRFENALHRKIKRFEKERKMDGFLKGHYDPCLKTNTHEWMDHEWFWSVDDETNQPTWSDASVLFIHASRIMPMGYENKRGKVIRKKLSIQRASKRIFKFFRLGPRWYSYVWKKRRHEKLNHLKEQYQWLNKGSILILAYLSDYPEKTQTRKYIQNDTFNWEGPIIDLTGGKKTAKEFQFLERRELFIPVNNVEEKSRDVIVPPAEQLNFEFYRKKTTRGEGLWKNKKAAAIVDISGTSIANTFDLEEVENNETKFKHK